MRRLTTDRLFVGANTATRHSKILLPLLLAIAGFLSTSTAALGQSFFGFSGVDLDGQLLTIQYELSSNYSGSYTPWASVGIQGVVLDEVTISNESPWYGLTASPPTREIEFDLGTSADGTYFVNFFFNEPDGENFVGWGATVIISEGEASYQMTGPFIATAVLVSVTPYPNMPIDIVLRSGNESQRGVGGPDYNLGSSGLFGINLYGGGQAGGAGSGTGSLNAGGGGGTGFGGSQPYGPKLRCASVTDGGDTQFPDNCGGIGGGTTLGGPFGPGGGGGGPYNPPDPCIDPTSCGDPCGDGMGGIRLLDEGGGCSGCGGGDIGLGGNQLITMLRAYPWNAWYWSSFGPGVFIEYDSSAYIVDQETHGISIRLYDAEIGAAFTLCEPDENGVFQDSLRMYHSTVLLDDEEEVTEDLSEAIQLVVRRWDGRRMVFEIYDDANEPGGASDNDKSARLTNLLDRNGQGTTITYSTSDTAEIDTVTDRYGYSMAFTYGTTVAGRPAVTEIELPNEETITISYADDFISEVEMPEGVVWTCDVGFDETSQQTTLTVTHPQYGERIYLIAPDLMEFNGNIISQPTNCFRSMNDENGQTILTLVPNPSVSDQYRLLAAGPRLSLLQVGSYHRYYSAWTLGDLGDGWDAFTNLTQEGAYSKRHYPSVPYGGITTEEEMENHFICGATPQYYPGVGPHGETDPVLFTFDDDFFVTRIDYPDETYEEFTYNDFKQVTRYRDRLANVTLCAYDGSGNLESLEVGIREIDDEDEPQPEYAEYTYDYYDTPAALVGNLKTVFSPLHDDETDLYRTDYTYHTNGQLDEVIEAADEASGARATTAFTYNSLGQVSTVTDPLEHVTTIYVDLLGRARTVEYEDGSTDVIAYGAAESGDEARVVWTKNRMNVVTSYDHDYLGRNVETIVGSHTADEYLELTAVTDVTQQRIATTEYLARTYIPASRITDGKLTEFGYDYRMRNTTVTRHANENQSLTTETVYVDNRVFYTEDPYGRREYMGYSVTNATEMIRRVQCAHPEYTLTDNDDVNELERDTSANAEFAISDAIKDAMGNVTEVIDAMDVSTIYGYDSRRRQVSVVAADGTDVEATTETDFDAASQVVEVRSPRYFDTSDAQDEYMLTLFTYTGRGLKKTQRVAPGASLNADATTAFTYTLDRKVATTTDPLSNVWANDYDNDCCGHYVGVEDPLGHGSMTYSDSLGRAYHGAVVEDYDSHSGTDPTDGDTYNEWTTRYDNLGRVTARTQWLEAQGTVDPFDVPIAGLDSVDEEDGLTTMTFYDNNIADGVGLDHSTGMTIPKLGGGTYSLSLGDVLTQLAETEANGGADTTFEDDVSAGSAVVTISPTEEIHVSISDAAGRTVITAQLQGWNGPDPFDLVTWNCMVYDQIEEVGGFGDVLETRSVNALGKVTKSRSDGIGRTLESYDELSKKSSSTFDANGNALSFRDPNGVGYDAEYDELNREISRTDTFGDEVQTVYDKESNVIESIDAKGKSTYMAYDAQNRKRTVTDRLENDTTYAFNAAGWMTGLTDAESQQTIYGYNNRGDKIEETYPDHTSGSPGDSTYGKILFAYDPARRLHRKDDQNGDTVTMVYDMANRVLQKDYRTRANSPTGTIADSDVFTYDRSSRMLTGDSGRYDNLVEHEYDFAGRLETESLTIDSVKYTVAHEYDILSRRNKTTYPNGSIVERAFTDRSQLYTTTYASNVEDTRAYDDGGRLTTSAYRNGVTATNAYRVVSSDKDNMLASISFSHPGGVASNKQIGTYTYDWDANKNKTKETITGEISGYSFDTTLGGDPDGYDDEDRLTYYKRSSQANPQTWTLTDVGDWSSWSNFGTSQSRTHGNAHELLTVGSSPNHSVSTDVKGNITEIPTNVASPARSLTWDFDNQLVSCASVTFEYDALNRRVSRTRSGTTKVYIHAGQQVVCDYASGAAANSTPDYRYVWGDYIDEPILRQDSGGTILYYHHNQQYSTIALTNSSGEVVSRYGYTAYGVMSIMNHDGTSQSYGTHSNRYTYTGREWDLNTTMYYFRARWYEPLLGRFVGRDPIGYVDGMSLYRGYFAIDRQDPYGLECWYSGRMWSELTGFTAKAPNPELKPSTSPAPFDRGFTNEVICICEITYAYLYECLSYVYRWRGCIRHRFEQKGYKYRYLKQLHLLTVPVRADTMIVGVNPVSLPLPGNQSLGVWYYDIHPDDKDRVLTTCERACSRAFHGGEFGDPPPAPEI